MRFDSGENTLKLIGWLIGLIVFLGMFACAGLIKIEPIPTPTPTSVPTSQPTVEVEVDAPTGVPVRVLSETIELDAPVVEMSWRLEEKWGQVISEWVVPDEAAGWHLNSARPGERGNVVISGHNNSTGGRVFGNLEELEIGNQLTVMTDTGEAYEYQINDKQIVRAFGASQETLDYLHQVIQPTETEQLTLISCWPSWTNTHRLIIIATPL